MSNDGSSWLRSPGGRLPKAYPVLCRSTTTRSRVSLGTVLRHEVQGTPRGSESLVRDIACQSSSFSVTLDDETTATLETWRRIQLEEVVNWGPAWTNTGLVFTREDGTAYRPEAINKMFAGLVKKAGVAPITLHGTRHTHATFAPAVGIHPKVVSERLGQSTLALTLDVYSHAIPAMEEEAAAKIAALVTR